jgi:hypothetical protein
VALGIAWEYVDTKYRTLVPRAGVPEWQIEASLAVIHGFRDVNDVSKLIDLLQV